MEIGDDGEDVAQESFFAFVRQFWRTKLENEKVCYSELVIDVHNAILKTISELDSLIGELEASIKSYPKRILEVGTKDGCLRFYQYVEHGKSRVYLGKDKEPMIRDLSQKRYDSGILKVALKQKAELEKTLERMERGRGPKSIDDVMSTIPEVLRQYIVPNERTNEGFVRKWCKPVVRSLRKGNVSKDGLYTIKGEHVRSKSELLIADRLHAKGVPYHYELAYSPDEGMTIIHPDFTVLNARTLEQFFWEHLGRMDDGEYAAAAKKRIERYAMFGFVPGRGLIVTFESSTSPIDTEYIRQAYRNIPQMRTTGTKWLPMKTFPMVGPPKKGFDYGNA